MGKIFLVAVTCSLGVLALVFGGVASAEQKKARAFKDPFAYCKFAGTIESPGASYSGPESPPEVERAVGGVATFRCQGGQVLGCALGASGRACMKKDLSRAPNADLVSYCRAQPNSDIDYATQGYSAYEWRCRGRTPQIVSGPSAESTGFISESWEVIPNQNQAGSQTGETNASGIVGTWEFAAQQCCGAFVGSDELPWEPITQAGRIRVTFYDDGRFVSTAAGSPQGNWVLDGDSLEGWVPYIVSVELKGDTLIVLHTPTSSQNAYAEKWQRVTSTNSGLQTSRPDKAISTSVGSAGQASSDTNLRQFIGYSNHDSCFGTVYRKSGCGSMDNLSLGGWGDYYYVFVQFDIDDLPDLANGGRAEIWLWGSAPNDPNLVVEKITQRWSESSLSLNNGPASTPLSRAPSVPTTPNWIKIDITNLYKSWKSGAAPNYGIKLTPRRNDQTNGSFASSENENANIRPRLVVMPERTR